MKTRFIISLLLTCVTLKAEERESSGGRSAFEAPEMASFTLASATMLADAQRQQRFGDCGVVAFKEKRGALWIFQTRIGHAGTPGPDIAIIEPRISLPSFTLTLKEPNKAPDPTPTSVTSPAAQEPRQP